ncbi:hypothetical protein NDI45_20320 [Leptolyngbya sp. GB1-A1]|uniref:hypothetical protein n=1 Tax=Leptolyngbya sp. GB1-A1 TaxID=2933908 RepID=UPI0032969A22
MLQRLSHWRRHIMGSKTIEGYTEETKQALDADLKALAAKPKRIPLRDLVRDLSPQIEAARKAGYSLAEIIEIFKKREVDIAENTLKIYMRDPKPRTAKPQGAETTHTKSRKKGQGQGEAASVSEPETKQSSTEPVNGSSKENKQSLQSTSDPMSQPPIAMPLATTESEAQFEFRVTGTDEKGIVKEIDDKRL